MNNFKKVKDVFSREDIETINLLFLYEGQGRRIGDISEKELYIEYTIMYNVGLGKQPSAIEDNRIQESEEERLRELIPPSEFYKRARYSCGPSKGSDHYWKWSEELESAFRKAELCFSYVIFDKELYDGRIEVRPGLDRNKVKDDIWDDHTSFWRSANDKEYGKHYTPFLKKIEGRDIREEYLERLIHLSPMPRKGYSFSQNKLGKVRLLKENKEVFTFKYM